MGQFSDVTHQDVVDNSVIIPQILHTIRIHEELCVCM